MYTYNEDLSYAKDICTLIQAFASGEMIKSKYIVQDISLFDTNIVITYTYALYMNTHRIISFSNQERDVSTSLSSISETDITVTSTAQNFFVEETREWFDYNSVQYNSESQHFQNSLIYDEKTNRNILTMAYLHKNLILGKYKYFNLTLHRKDALLTILKGIRNDDTIK